MLVPNRVYAACKLSTVAIIYPGFSLQRFSTARLAAANGEVYHIP